MGKKCLVQGMCVLYTLCESDCSVYGGIGVKLRQGTDSERHLLSNVFCMCDKSNSIYTFSIS